MWTNGTAMYPCRTIGRARALNSSMNGSSGRTLRAHCQEQLGVSPHHFLALRRLHLARRTLLRSHHRLATVTDIVMSHEVWQRGRFAVMHKSLFGESPSATLHRPPRYR